MWNGVRMLAVRNQEVQMLMPTEADWKIIRELLFGMVILNFLRQEPLRTPFGNWNTSR
ncbi:11470_t:CDS:2 [Rhizophagus irregularis]|nr:11470_t:CDS:2 [Rhizophagus irregularis]